MARPRTRSRIEDHHAEWLSLVETSGPFLTVPTLKRALPNGLEATPSAMSALRIAHAEWREDPGLQARWVRWVLDDVLELRDAASDATDADPSHRVAEQGVTLRPSFVVRDATLQNAPAVLLVHRYPADTSLDRPIPGEAWAASPIDRAAELARASEVELALVTDGSRWTMVWARRGETTGTCTWRAELWLEEPVTLRAFATLLGARRFFALPEDQGLAGLLRESASKQQEVADQLGAQVRRAVELLVATLDREDRDRHGALLEDLEGAEVYRGATTVMMRLVFLFVAEERRLLPIDDPRYAGTLAASTLRAQLQERADRDGEDPLERSTAAWHRVLALFRAVHGGIEHDALRLPAYGGGLFDPDRYPFLEGRAPGSRWHEALARPLPVDDRTMLHLLDALQTLEQGGARVLLSYRALDVEQIGHVYEGLLDHTAIRVSDAVLGLGGREEPELALGEVEDWAAEGEDVLVERLAKAVGRSVAAVGKALSVKLDDERRARLRAACASDGALADRVAPYHALLRDDLRGDPLVLLPGALFVTQALDRRSSGTYYTPRQLAEEVVHHALDPVTFAPGPAEERDPAAWRLRPAAELLELKIADIAMGSGAFLVAACRYLAARLLEAWEALGEGEWTAFGRRREEAGDEPTLPADPQEREQLAHRLVAERCLYGVDKNPMAVEMAKVSLWLITLARERPFSFLDHALRAGDSLLGVTDLRQLRAMHLDPGWHRQASFDLGLEAVERAVTRALALRRDLEAFVVRDVRDAERKAALLAEADTALEDGRLLGDLVVGAALAQLDDADPLGSTGAASHIRTMLDAEASWEDRAVARTQVHALAQSLLVERRGAFGDVAEIEFADRDPMHWALEFPEVQAQGGFDAIVGNPPFQGGQKISGTLGGHYRDFLVTWLAGGVRGSADLVAYFVLRAARGTRAGGAVGLIATNTIGQGNTREVGLDPLLANDHTLSRAVPTQRWPGGAALEVALLWLIRGTWNSPAVLAGNPVVRITSSLEPAGRVHAEPMRLATNSQVAFQGVIVLGTGFVLDPAEAARVIAKDARNAEVVRPYLDGDDLNGDPLHRPRRWVIDFRDWSLERASSYQELLDIVEQRVKPTRLANADAGARRYWWRPLRPRSEMRQAIAGLDQLLVIARVSKTLLPAIVSSNQVFHDKVVVFGSSDSNLFGVLTSSFHWWWAITGGTTLRLDATYTPERKFETFPQPNAGVVVPNVASRLMRHRSALMLDRQEGLTKTYNRVHDPEEAADDIIRLRELHVELDHAVRDAYGWGDLELGHGFHSTKFGVRYTFAPVPRQEILDRLLELNHARYAEEVRQGLHKPKGKRSRTSSGAMTLGLDRG